MPGMNNGQPRTAIKKSPKPARSSRLKQTVAAPCRRTLRHRHHRVFSLLWELSEHLGLAVVMVTHNMELAAAMDHRLTLADSSLH